MVPWLIGAKALIHNNCTTGVEAAVIATPVLNFRPWVSDEFDNPLVHAFGQDCRDAEQLAAEITRIVAGEATGLTKAREEKLRHHIVSLDGALASDRIVDMLEAETGSEPNIGARGKFAKRFARYLRDRRLWIGRFARLWFTKEGRAKRAFLRDAYPNFRLASLEPSRASASGSIHGLQGPLILSASFGR